MRRNPSAKATRKRTKKVETHLVEWKESWRDEYLKWLCGFANADGGTLIIGMNDKGEPVGARDADRLLIDLPNKIRDTLGLADSDSCSTGPFVDLERGPAFAIVDCADAP